MNRNFSISSCSNLTVLILLSAVWVLAIVIVNPVGNFPLNDDWAYAWSVKELLESGNYKLSDWAAANLLPQIFWGALFCLPLGFSFTALRIATLVLSLVGVFATYGLVKEMTDSYTYALLGALVLMLNPIYFALSNSFMTDVPSLSVCVVALYLFVRGYKNHSNIELSMGVFWGLIAVLNRQSSIVILLAFGCAYTISKGLRLRTVFLGFMPLVMGLLLNYVYSYWLSVQGLEPALFGFQINEIREALSNNISRLGFNFISNLFFIFTYLGLFLLPILAIQIPAFYEKLSKKRKLWAVLLCVVVGTTSGITAVFKGPMPYLGNVLEFFSIGPQFLEGYYSFLSLNGYRVLTLLWILLTVAGVLGGVTLISFLYLSLVKIFFKGDDTDVNQRFGLALCALTILLYLSIISMLDEGLFDRYLIFVLPPFLVLIGNFSIGKTSRVIASRSLIFSLMLLLFLSIFSIAATHDYLASNRTRWLALDTLIAQGEVDKASIGGGFEYNGWNFGNRLEVCNPSFNLHDKPDWSSFTCLWNNPIDQTFLFYEIAYIPKESLIVEKKYSFRRWLPWRLEFLYVLKNA